MDTPIVKINDQDYKLKITLGFYKMLSFEQERLSFIDSDIDCFLEVLKLAIFFGNKKAKSWKTVKDLEKEISEEDFLNIDDNNVKDSIGTAFFINLPDTLQEAHLHAKKAALEEFEEETKKNFLLANTSLT